MDIVEMIENNPIKTLSETYQHTLLERIKSRFSQEEQSMFIASMYGFLNYSRTDYVIDLDDIWKWCGFSLKLNAKRVLEKNFVIDKEYKCLLCKLEKQKGRGGKNKEQILMTINTFKRFCMKAGTKKAEQIHEYYINLEETLQEVINEECSQLREQIENQTKQIQNNEQESKRLREKTILQQFSLNSQYPTQFTISHSFIHIYSPLMFSFFYRKTRTPTSEPRHGTLPRKDSLVSLT